MHRRALRRRCHDNNSVLKRTLFFELAYNACDRRRFLTNRNVDAFDALATLVNDRVNCDRRLAGLTIANDQFALAAADRHHRVNGLQACLHGLID